MVNTQYYMKKYYLLFAINIFGIFIVQAQQTFYTQIHDNNLHKPWDILIKSDGNMLFCSFYRSDDASWSSIWELDQTGEIVNEWTFANSNGEFFRATRILEVEKQIFLFGEGQITYQGNTEVFVSLRKFDFQLSEKENHRFNLTGMPNIELIPMRVIYKDQIFHILTSVTYDDLLHYTPAYFMVSSTGYQLHTAFLPPSSDQILLPYDFCLLPGSENLFTVVLDCLTLFNTFGVVTEFDSEMNIVSQIPLLTNSGPSMLDFGIMGSSDTSFYTIYNKVHYNTQFNSVVETRDLAGNTLNQFKYECPEDSASWIAYRNALDVLPDGNLIFCTTKNIDFYPGVQPEPTQIRFFKLRPDLGLIWQKFLFGDDGNYRVWGIKAHPDGGIVVSGTYSPTPPLNGAMEIFFMKTDSEGLLTNIGEGEPKIKTTEAILYPNPASENITIEFSQVYQTANFRLMDIGGKVVLEKELGTNYQSINISSFPSGTYVYRIVNKKGLDERGKLVVE
jgi:hypothetical protein